MCTVSAPFNDNCRMPANGMVAALKAGSWHTLTPAISPMHLSTLYPVVRVQRVFILKQLATTLCRRRHSTLGYLTPIEFDANMRLP